MISEFDELIRATHLAYFPENRPGKELDYLRHDLSVFSENDEILLTNVTGHFMVGLPPSRGAEMDTWGDHVFNLSSGIGQLSASLLGQGIDTLTTHGSRPAGVVK